ELRVCERERRRIVGADPPDDRVIPTMLVSIFGGELRLPDAAQAGDDLHAMCGRFVGEQLPKVGKNFSTTGEVRIARIRQIPDGGRGIGTDRIVQIHGHRRTLPFLRTRGFGGHRSSYTTRQSASIFVTIRDDMSHLSYRTAGESHGKA